MCLPPPESLPGALRWLLSLQDTRVAIKLLGFIPISVWARGSHQRFGAAGERDLALWPLRENGFEGGWCNPGDEAEQLVGWGAFWKEELLGVTDRLGGNPEEERVRGHASSRWGSWAGLASCVLLQ